MHIGDFRLCQGPAAISPSVRRSLTILSVVMPVYKPKKQHLIASLHSTIRALRVLVGSSVDTVVGTCAEIVVIDDGSDDAGATAALLSEIQSKVCGWQSQISTTFVRLCCCCYTLQCKSDTRLITHAYRCASFARPEMVAWRLR